MLSWETYLAAREEIAEKLMGLDDATWQETDEAAMIDFNEHFWFQQNQAEAFAAGRIATDVAQRIYVSLGEVHSDEPNGGWRPDVSLAEKLLITKLMAELLARKILA